jgi:signal transduction histidine kinase
MIKLQLASNCDKDIINYIDFSLENVETLSNWHKKLLGESINYSNCTFRISEMINHIQRLISSQISKRLCVIKCDIDIPILKGEYFEILRVFKNLIENSIKHAKANKLVISISGSKVDDHFARIIFNDNGSHLSQKDRNKIESTLTKDTKSIGLEICRDILSNHNGTIKLLKGSKGCSYEIKLPIGQ